MSNVEYLFPLGSENQLEFTPSQMFSQSDQTTIGMEETLVTPFYGLSPSKLPDTRWPSTDELVYQKVTSPLVVDIVNDALVKKGESNNANPDTNTAFIAMQKVISFTEQQPEYLEGEAFRRPLLISNIFIPVVEALGFQDVSILTNGTVKFSGWESGQKIDLFMDFRRATLVDIIKKGDYNTFMLIGGFSDYFDDPLHDQLIFLREEIQRATSELQFSFKIPRRENDLLEPSLTEIEDDIDFIAKQKTVPLFKIAGCENDPIDPSLRNMGDITVPDFMPEQKEETITQVKIF